MLKASGGDAPRGNTRSHPCLLYTSPGEVCFKSYEELLAKPRMADCALVCTQDHAHCAPVLKASQKGYHILCEKPLSPYEDELIAMGRLAKESKQVFSVCHVLRYSPFFMEIKRLLDGGAIGELTAVQHIEICLLYTSQQGIKAFPISESEDCVLCSLEEDKQDLRECCESLLSLGQSFLGVDMVIEMCIRDRRSTAYPSSSAHRPDM